MRLKGPREYSTAHTKQSMPKRVDWAGNRKRWDKSGRFIKVVVTLPSGNHSVSLTMRRDNSTTYLYREVWRLLNDSGADINGEMILITQEARKIVPRYFFNNYLTDEEKEKFTTCVPREECELAIALDIVLTAVVQKRNGILPWYMVDFYKEHGRDVN